MEAIQVTRGPKSGNRWCLAVVKAQLHVMIGVLEVLRRVGASTQHAGQARGNDHRLGGLPLGSGTRTGKPQIR